MFYVTKVSIIHRFGGAELNETFDQTVNYQTIDQAVTIQTFSSKWVEDVSIMKFYFQVEIHQGYYRFTDITVDIQVTDDKYLPIRANSDDLKKYRYRYKSPKEYFIGKRQTNCTYKNIQITLSEINAVQCVLLMNFTYLRFEFLNVEQSECVMEISIEHVFAGEELNETFYQTANSQTIDQSVTIQTFSSKWVEDISIMKFYFQLETHHGYYSFTDIRVDIQVTNASWLPIRSKNQEPDKFHYSYKSPNDYFIGKRQTNCTYNNILFTLNEINEVQCSLLMNFTYLRFEFLNAEKPECVIEVNIS
ncbi:hypothetical protein RF11_01524 [Thelohanellus kitauei]|uniref:Uncharacterized protein n=1 Tax=Thelohanellus kitauei TaxID=669202 RepID=A0A0C2MXQ7_THEKT|nr:hypothetical protein RF11_01524 [Thelohanellus kitauei]